MKSITKLKKKLILLIATCGVGITSLVTTILLANKNYDYNEVTAASKKNYTLTITSFSWKNTYYCYANTSNGNKLTFKRESSYHDGKYNIFTNNTAIHHIKAITATFTASSVKIGWNKVAQTSTYTEVPSHGTSESSYYSYASLTSNKRYAFSYGQVYYFVIWDTYNYNNLGLSKIIIEYYC